MKQKLFGGVLAVAAGVAVFAAGPALAQGTSGKSSAAALAAKPAASATLSPGTLIQVNGVAITEAALDRVLSGVQAQGGSVNPQLREQVLSEMVVRQLLVGEAQRRGFDKSAAFLQQQEELRQRLLMDAVVADYLEKNPISEADERAEYARQKKVLGDGETTPQYLLSQLVFKTEQQARDVIAQIKAGTALSQLASQSADEATRAKGGQLGWLFPTDVIAPIANVMVNLPKGSVSAAPIQSTNGWHVIQVDDVRPFKIPAFEDSRPQLRQSLQLQRRQAMLEALLKSADIKRP